MMYARRLYALSFSVFFSSKTHSPIYPNTTSSSSILTQYLTDRLSFPLQRALSVSDRFPRHNSNLQKPESVVRYLQEFGFSDSQIRSSILRCPDILFSDVANVLKPKLDFFKQHLGLTTTDLGNLIPKNPLLLLYSLDKKLVPIVRVFKEIVVEDGRDNLGLVTVLQRCGLLFSSSQSRLLSNVALLKNFRVVGSQLSILLKMNPCLFFLEPRVLEEQVSLVLERGVPIDSKMFVHALKTVCGMSPDNFSKKIDLFMSFGFSEEECFEAFRRDPLLFRSSVERLRFGIEFFLNHMDDLNFERSMLVSSPQILGYSIEKRVIPRSRVLRIIKRKQLRKKEPSLLSVLPLREEIFLERFVLKYEDDVEELLMAYKGDLLDSSCK